MKSSRVHRVSSSCICAHRSAAGAARVAGAAVVERGGFGAGAGVAAGWVTAGSEPLGDPGRGCAARPGEAFPADLAGGSTAGAGVGPDDVARAGSASPGLASGAGADAGSVLGVGAVSVVAPPGATAGAAAALSDDDACAGAVAAVEAGAA